MKDVMAPFLKCVLENSLNPDFQSLETTYFPCTIFKIQKDGEENHPGQPFQEDFFGQNRTPCLGHLPQDSVFGTFSL